MPLKILTHIALIILHYNSELWQKFTFFLGYSEQNPIQCGAVKQFTEQSELLSDIRAHACLLALATSKAESSAQTIGAAGAQTRTIPRRLVAASFPEFPAIGAFQMRADFITEVFLRSLNSFTGLSFRLDHAPWERLGSSAAT